MGRVFGDHGREILIVKWVVVCSDCTTETLTQDAIFCSRIHLAYHHLQFTAILDLVDNSLDASIKNIDQGFLGRCFISPDTHTYNDDNNDWDISITTGITIINNCISKPRPLQQCLEVYDSSKVDSGKDSVGENGVGLKQACATLSDSSFVLIKSDEGHGEITCELGIVAEMLQKAEGA